MAKKRFLVLIGLALLIFLLSQFNIQRIIQAMLKANPIFALGTLPVVFLAVVLKSFKWNLALAKAGIRIRFSQAIRLFCVGFFLSVTTPARLGDFAKALYLRKQAPLATTVATIFFDRVFDALMLVVSGAAGIALFFYFFHSTLIPTQLVLAVLAVAAAGTIVFFRLNGLLPLFRPIFSRMIPKEQQKTLSLNFHRFYEEFLRLFRSKKLLAASAILSLVSALLGVAVGFLLAQSLSLNIPITFLLVIIPVIALLDLLPISLLGLGTRETMLVYAFSFLSLSGESALSFSFLFLLFSYLSVALAGMAFFLMEPLPSRKDWFSAEKKPET